MAKVCSVVMNYVTSRDIFLFLEMGLAFCIIRPKVCHNRLKSVLVTLVEVYSYAWAQKLSLACSSIQDV